MKKPFKIMHVLLTLNTGGAENLVLKLMGKIDRSLYIPHICSLTENGDLEQDFVNMDVPVFVVKKREGIDYSLPFRLSILFRRQKIDLIHTHNISPYLYGVTGAKLAQVPVIIHTEHSNLFPNQRKLIIAERFLAKISDIIISDSQKVEQFLIRNQNISQKKITTILNGIDIDSFDIVVDKLKKRRELGIEIQDLTVGNVARLVSVKDHNTLFIAFKKVSEVFDNVKLIIAGDGPLRNKLENLRQELGLSEKIILLGNRRDIPELMAIFDVFVLSSISEGLSLTLLEAMAAGRAVVATNVGGNPEVVEDKVTGMLVPPGNSLVLAEAIIELLKDKRKQKEMGELGRKRVEQYFSLNTMVKRYEAIYKIFLTKK